MLARAKGAAAPSARKQASTKQKPKLKTFIENRDFVGASTFLEVRAGSRVRVLRCCAEHPVCVCVCARALT